MSSTLSETSLVQRPRRFFLCLILVTALGALDHTIVATALPDIAGELGSPQRTSWVVAAYTLAITAAMPAVGALGDRFGRRQVLAGSVLVFLIASVACGLATGIEMLALARFFQGLGGAGLLVLPQAVVADVVPVRERAAYLGPLGAVFAVATVVSPCWVAGSPTSRLGAGPSGSTCRSARSPCCSFSSQCRAPACPSPPPAPGSTRWAPR